MRSSRHAVASAAGQEDLPSPVWKTCGGVGGRVSGWCESVVGVRDEKRGAADTHCWRTSVMSHGTKSAGARAPPSPMHSACPGTRRIRPPPDASITQVEPLQLLEARRTRSRITSPRVSSVGSDDAAVTTRRPAVRRPNAQATRRTVFEGIRGRQAHDAPGKKKAQAQQRRG